ncbi:unnamed protein product [Rotaria magnacalcarata]|nr:unnamed protein product [Rotaria magnacalcarata]
MLSYGKYQTSQMPSNISYTSRYYGLNFLAYSPIDDLLIFIEPKHQIHIYNGHTIQLIANVNTTDVVSATSCASLLSESQHELFFIYETNTESNLISLRVCEVQFDIPNLKFEENICIGTIIVQYDQPDLRLNSFTIKRDHAETNKSLLFISTDIGLVYAVFETNTGVLVNEPTIMNETLNEGSVVVSSDGSVYYASKQEHLIYELHITKDFRLNFGQIIKANGIKHPFGLITDECNHLYIATRSMILVMSLKTFSTIRSVFSKASDLPITLERLNSTTYVYATIRANAKKLPSYWMFNFLYFTEGEKIFLTTRQPAVNQEEDFNSADITADDISMPILWPLSYFLPSETNKTKKYTQFFSTARKSSSESRKSNRSQKKKHNSIDSEISAISKEDLLTQNTPTVPSAPDLSDSNRSKNSDPDHKLIGNTQHDSHQKLNKSLQNNVHSETYLLQNTSFDSQSFSKHTTESSISDDDLRARIEKEKNLSIHTNNHSRDYTSKRPLTDSNLANVTTEAKERPFSDDDLQAFIEGRANFSKTQETQIKAYLEKQSLLNRSIASQFTTSTKTPISDTNALDHTTNTDTTVFSDDDLQSFLEGRGNFSKEREIQIKDYLSKQSSSNRDLISKYSTSTRLPGRISTTGDSIHSGRKTENTYSQKYPTEISVIDSKSLNRTADTEGIIFSDDDLRSYREGRGNLSKEREMQIQAYLSKRSSSSPNIFSRYSIGTVPPGHIYTTDHMHENTTTPQVNSENIQRFTDSDGISISHDDLQSYLQGRGNLSLAKQKLIQAYLAEQSASNRSTTSQHVNSSKNLPTTKHIPHETDSQDYHSQMPFSVLENIDRTIDKEEIYFSDEDIQSFLKSRGNLSKKQEEQIRTYLNKQSLSNKTTSVSTFAQSTKLPAEPETMDNNIYTDPLSKNTLAKDNVTKKPLFDLDHLKSTIEDDELRLYLEGRSNMSKSRIAQIEAYLNKQSSLKQNIFSSNSTSTKAPTALYTSTENVYVDHKSQLALIPDNLTRKPSSELENFNALLDSEDKSFSNDELRSFLEGRANFSKKKEAQIEVYLNKQSSRYPNEFSTYPTSGKTPAESDKLAHEKHSEYQSEDTHLQNYSTKTPLSDPKLFNQTIDSQAIIFTDDDLQSFLEGRANLSKIQKTHIETYLSQTSPVNRSITVKNPTHKKLPVNIHPIDGKAHANDRSEHTQEQELDSKKTLSDSKDTSRTVDTDHIVFTEDDLRSFLEGRSNLSQNQKAKIQSYLNKQSSYDISSTSASYLSNKIQTSQIHAADDNMHTVHQSEASQSPTISKDIVFSEDELRAYLEGRTNLSRSREAQIQAYLSKNSSLDQNQFSTSTQILTPIHGTNDKLHEKHESHYPATPKPDSKFLNGTKDSQAIIFTDDELRSFLQGRANLSKSQKSQIETYLSQTSSLNRSIYVRYPIVIKSPTKVYPLDRNEYRDYESENTYSQSYLTKKPLADSKKFNQTMDTQGIIFSGDDLRSLLEDRVNLSQNQKFQMEAYLNKQISSDRTTPSNYSTSTSQTTNIKVPDERVNSLHGNNNTQFRDNSRTTPLPSWKDFRRTIDTQGITFTDNDLRSFLQDHVNLSQDQKIQIEAYLRKQSSANQSIFSNYQTSLKPPVKTSTSEDNVEPHDEGKETESQRIMFSDDELRSFLEGRANLSKKKKEKIEIYLNHQSLSNQSSFSRSSTIAKVPIGINPSNNKVDHYDENARTYSGNYLTTIRPSDSKDSSASTASESIIFSDDDVQSYLQGRSNLSSIQETQIQAYLAKQTSSNGSVFSRYFTSTGKPTPHDESWIVPDRLTNISLRDPQGSLHPGSLPKIDFNSTSRRVTPSKSISQNLSSMKPFTNSPTTILQRPWQSTGNQTHDLSKSIEKRQNISSDSNYDNNLQIDTFNEHSQLLKSTTNPSSDDHDEYYDTENKEKPFDSSEDDSNQLSSWPTHSTVSMNTDEAKEILTTIFSDEKSKIDKSMHRLSTISLSERLTRDKSNIHDSSILKDHNLVTKPNGIHTDKGSTLHFTNSNEQAIVQEDDVYVNLSISITKFESKPHSTFSSVTPYELTATKIKNFSADETARFRTKYPVDIKTNRTPSESLVHSDVNTTHIDKISLVTNQSGIHFPVNKNQIFSPKISNSSILQSQSIINDTSNTFDTPRHDLDDESKSIQDEIIHHKQTSTNATLMTNQTLISNVTSGYFNQNFKDEMKHESSSAVSVGVNVSSTLRILLPFIISSTTLLSSHRSPLSSPLHHSPAYTSSTRFTKSTLLSSSKLFSGTSTVIRKKVTTTTTTTTRPSYPADFTSSIHILQASNKHSNIQTTDSATTSVIVPSKLMTTPSLLITSEPYLTSTISSALFLKTNKQSTSTTVFDTYTTSQLESSSSSSYFKSTDLFSTDVQSITATSVPSTKFDSSPIIISDKMPMHSTLPTKLESNVFLFTSQPLKTTDTLHLSSLSTDKYQEKSTSFDVASRSFPSIYKSKIFTTLQHTTVDVSNSSSKFSLPLSIQTTSSPKTSTRRHRTRKPKVNTWQKAPASTIALPTTSIATSYQTTFNQDYELATSTQLSTDTSERTIFEPEQTFIIKPSFIQNDSTTILSNDILSQLFSNTSTSTNSSTERFIYFNLVDLPPSSWDLSLNSNESFVLDLVLPSSANSNATSNLTFTNIEATSLSTKIVGAPINLQVDRVQTKHFSLAVNATDSGSNRNRTKSSVSDVIIGHVRSEKFELNFTKTDNMNVRVQQVDSATADLYFDSHFCTNESNLEINLNLSQNGTIRYGDRAPIHIGPVFTRVHMLKQSCDREQPLTLFFDICERQNPCFNGGTCVSIIPNYEDSSYSRLDVGDIGYKCDCSPQTSGEHCQNSEFPSAYCLNGGSLFQLYDRHNKSIEKCICPTGFRGEHCEENIDNCIEITCSSHGICEDGIDKYTCSCFDGFYGINCERKHVQTALLQAASRSFGIVAILLIATIVGLVVASDIHTFLTRKQEAQSIGNKILRVSSELYENSVLLLGFSDAPIELNDLSRVRTWKKSASLKQRQTHRTTRKRKPAGYGQLARRKAVRTTLRSSSQRYLETNQLNQPII